MTLTKSSRSTLGTASFDDETSYSVIRIAPQWAHGAAGGSAAAWLSCIGQCGHEGYLAHGASMGPQPGAAAAPAARNCLATWHLRSGSIRASRTTMPMSEP